MTLTSVAHCALLLAGLSGACGSSIELAAMSDALESGLPAICDKELTRCYDPDNGLAFCADLSNDPENCGGCGEGCPIEQTCSAGTCVEGCRDGMVVCDGACLDPEYANKHCGAQGDCLGDNAGVACPQDEKCLEGTCVPACPQGMAFCAGGCVDPMTSAEHCGAYGACVGGGAGEACAAGEICSAGNCALQCQAGLIECGWTCVDPTSSLLYCGAVGNCLGKNRGVECGDGFLCTGGQCLINCQPDLVECNGLCTDPLTSQVHCGASGDCLNENAGSACAAGETCYFGECTLLCQAGMIVCDGLCTDPLSSNAHCGATADCLDDNAGELCEPGSFCTDGECS